MPPSLVINRFPTYDVMSYGEALLTKPPNYGTLTQAHYYHHSLYCRVEMEALTMVVVVMKLSIEYVGKASSSLHCWTCFCMHDTLFHKKVSCLECATYLITMVGDKHL